MSSSTENTDKPKTDTATNANTAVDTEATAVAPMPVLPKTTSQTFTEIQQLFDDVQTIIKDYIVVIVIAFLAMFILMRVVGGENTILGSWVSNMIDIFVLVILFTWVGYDFIFTYSGEERNEQMKEAWNSFKAFVSDTYSILYTSVFIVAFYTFVYVVGIPMGDTQSIFVGLVDKGAWTLLIMSVVVWVVKTFFGISLFDGLTKEKGEEKEEEEGEGEGEGEGKGKEKKPVVKGDEVFNIGNNKYTYEDAQSICKSYGARLATYDDIEAAYNKGAEWCNYGWSEGQMAYFPTQKASWTELQKDEKHKNNCGRPGINGGYMVNPYLRFGVNCYGKKPEPTPSELAKMNVRKEKIVPKTKEDVILDMKVKFWKENADKLLNIGSFNLNKWSQY